MEFKDAIDGLKKSGAFKHFDINIVYKDKPFGPELIDEVSRQLKIRKNRILIG